MKYVNKRLDDLSEEINGTVTLQDCFDAWIKNNAGKAIPLQEHFDARRNIGYVDNIRREGNILRGDVTTFADHDIVFDEVRLAIGYRLGDYRMEYSKDSPGNTDIIAVNAELIEIAVLPKPEDQ